jgi:hypothetical protein
MLTVGLLAGGLLPVHDVVLPSLFLAGLARLTK